MARKLRIDHPNSWHHVMNRRARKDPVFHSQTDADSFLGLISAMTDRFGVEVHAYCLMTNHYHLLIRSVDGHLSQAMHFLDGVYAQRYNWRHGHDGPLWRGRFHSILVDSDEYLTTVTAYIHRNPLEAGIVRELTDYQWSSYPAYLGRRRPERWLDTAHVRSYFSSTGDLREVTERTPLPNDVETFYGRPALGPVLGSPDFRLAARRRVESAGGLTPSLARFGSQVSVSDVARLVAKVFNVPLSTIVEPSKGRRRVARTIALALAMDDLGLTQEEVREDFGLASTSALRKARAHAVRLQAEDPSVAAKIETIAKKLGREANL